MLNRPLLVQYGDWLGRVLKGDLGESYYYGTRVWSELTRRLPNTLASTGAISLGLPRRGMTRETGKGFPAEIRHGPRQGVPEPGGSTRASRCLSALRAIAAVLQVVRANVPRIPACGALRRRLYRRAPILQNPQTIAAFGGDQAQKFPFFFCKALLR